MDFTESRFDPIEGRIVVTLESLSDNSESTEWTTAEWTRRVKTEVARLGMEKGMLVYAHSAGDVSGGEWLYDLCWLQYDGAYLKRSVLILESEWTPRDVSDDFQKLVVGRADYRVMIFTVPTKSDRDSEFRRLLEHPSTYAKSQANDRYLMCCWKNEARGFDSRVYVGAPS